MQHGFSLLELAIALAVVLAVAGVLLGRLRLYQEAAEKAAVEYTVNTLRLALQLRIARELGRHMPVDYAAVARENPVSWLETPMTGYRGAPTPSRWRCCHGEAGTSTANAQSWRTCRCATGIWRWTDREPSACASRRG